MVDQEYLRLRIDEAANAVQNTEIRDWQTPYSGKLSQAVDHTLLKTDATQTQIDALCGEAKQHEFKAVCVRLKWVHQAVRNLQSSSVVVACVVGFHEGTYATAQKVAEAAGAIEAGATEIDMVIKHALLKQNRLVDVFHDVEAVRKAASSQFVLKVILETSELTDADIVAGCVIAQLAGADFVKTSTGFTSHGATVEHVRLMKAVVGERLGVKASGGVRTLDHCKAMISAGAHRIGTSNGVSIVDASSIVQSPGIDQAEGTAY